MSNSSPRQSVRSKMWFRVQLATMVIALNGDGAGGAPQRSILAAIAG
ncbi:MULTISPECIES: hypothetical protein [unclassified Synechocystis]|nr:MULTISPECIES: hypothetical protein [unclassified Synechocystis]